MDTAEIFVTLGGILLIAFNLWFFFGARDTASQHGTHHDGARHDGAQQKTPDDKPYACPMHPWITSDDPTANCSICGMKLVKRD